MATATYVPLATTTLGSATSTITFSSIPSGYTDLKIVLANAKETGGTFTPYVNFNSDTGTNYSVVGVSGADNGTTSSTASTNRNTLPIGFYSSGNISQTYPATIIIDIFSYTGSTYKTMLSLTAGDQTNSGTGEVEAIVGLWRSTSAITTVSLYGGNGWATGTTATLWGI